jgi:hypothetical protein
MRLKINQTAAVLIFILAGATSTIAGDRSLYKSSFLDADRALWTGWSMTPQAIEYVADGGEGRPALKYTVADGWNTPVINFSQPIPVSENTIVRFRLKCGQGRNALNIGNKTEEAQYYLSFMAPSSGAWFTVQKYLGKALFKRFGKDGVPKDGLVGDLLASVQIATGGPEVWVSDFEVLDAGAKVKELPAEEPLSLSAGVYKPRKYEIVDKVFPYGFIYQAGAGAQNAQIFGQSKQERYDESVRDLKHHYMNVFCNFCDDADLDFRLDLCSKYDMHLMETLFCGAQFYHQADTTKEAAIVKKASVNSGLLAWYGPDEPSDYKAWLGNKLAISSYDKQHPVVSAFNNPETIAQLGPYSEVAMINIYSILKGSFEASSVLHHADAIRVAKRYVAGQKVWFLPQCYGDRGSMRYPTPEEIRLEVFNSIAAGVDGMVFFIYNDSCSYLAPKVVRADSEIFDDTPIDPWFNDNPTYREMARLGRDVIPIMPSIMGSKETTAETDIDSAEYRKTGLVFSSFASPFGTVYVTANKSLKRQYEGNIQLKAASGQQVYDLIALKPLKLDNQSKLTVKLEAGDGAIYLAADEKSWERIRSQIRQRKIAAELELSEQDSRSLREAKLDTASLDQLLANAKNEVAAGKLDAAEKSASLAVAKCEDIAASNNTYLLQRNTLEMIRADFGSIHSGIKAQTEILAGSSDPEWIKRYDRIREYSREYYRLRNCWKTGDFSNTTQLVQLHNNLKALKVAILTLH